jgi:hypothetical protein
MMTATQAWAARSINEQRPADSHATVQINSVAGTLEVLGWDQPRVEVTGQLPGDGDSVEISGDSTHVSVQVRVAASSHLFGGHGGDARISVHVPTASTVITTLVSADFKTAGVSGDLELHTVSGDSKGEVGGNLRASSVSGDIRLAAPAAHELSVKTVSGDMEVSGGNGDADIATVSGSGHVTLGVPSHLHVKSTSGDLHVQLGIGADSRIEGESVSGDLSLQFRNAPAADFDVQTHSGEIDNCFGPKPEERSHGPGEHLEFRNGTGTARVRIVSHSGDVSLCSDEGPRR